MTYLELKKEFNININQIKKFLAYLKKTNEVMNLTSLTNEEEMIEKHIYDSLLVSRVFDFKDKNVLDVGSGGGFPGIPLAILFPTSHFVLVDSTAKKVNYLKNVINELNLLNVEAKCVRVEELKEYEKYDVIIARALSELRIYLELVTHLAKINGTIIALKGSKASVELDQASNAIKQLNLSLFKIQATSLPCGDKRTNFIFAKKDKTKNIYPRKFATIKNHPL